MAEKKYDYEPGDSRAVTHQEEPDGAGLVATGAREDEARKRAEGERPDIENNPDDDIIERAIEDGAEGLTDAIRKKFASE
ncbi:hypothetical protein [Aurantiacibacter sp. MUD61]|uniref:hypothetical protein n=1 Tax=Aurantiacibacter sp. MUD61 TaxID=3009083 RepID=UPI0022F071A9|nr:hypothetical protein [Aurantiacibacter sp. MUD61]